MSQVSMHFNLPEEELELQCAIRGADWKHTLNELDEYLRGIIKYGDDKTTEQMAVYEEIREKLWALVRENNLDL
jgi:hypothetical protein